MRRQSIFRAWLVATVVVFGAGVLVAPPLAGTAMAAKKKKKGKPGHKAAGGAMDFSAAGGESDAEAARIDIKKEADLAPKKDYDLDLNISKTKDLRPIANVEKRPALDIKALKPDQMDAMLDDKIEEEIGIAEQLRIVETGCQDLSPVNFRLAELNREKSKRAFFKANDANTQDKDRKHYTEVMTQLQGRSIQYFQQIVDECSDFKDFAKVLYSVGEALVESGKPREGAAYFQRVIKEYPDSEWVPNAWFQVGEYYFNSTNDAVKALKAYTKAAEFPNTSIYGLAIYKMGWCYINVAEWEKALDKFRQVIAISDDTKQDLDVRGRMGLRKEGIKDFVRAYANIGDVHKAYSEFRKVAGPADVPQMLENLGNWYINQGDHAKVVIAYQDLIKNFPDSTRIPLFQGRVVDAVSFQNDKKETVTQSKLLADYFVTLRKRTAAGKINDAQKATLDKDIREAEDVAENTLRRLATDFYKEARKLKGAAEDRTFRYAYELFKQYLTVFPAPRKDAEVNYVFYMRFYYAEVLYKLEKFKDAAENYAAVVDMNPHPSQAKEKEIVLAAAEETVRAYDELVDDLDRKNPPEFSGTEPKPIPDIKVKLIEACRRYIEYVGSAGEKIVEIRFKMARVFYQYNHFDEAAPAFDDIVKNHPQNSVACYAANLALDIYNGAKNYRALKETARSYLDNPKLTCTAKDKESFAKIEESASFNVVKTEFEDQKKYVEAAHAYLAFFKAFPSSDKAEDAVYNAAVDYDLGNHLDQANEVRRFLVEKLPNSKLVPETLFNMAKSYERVVDFENASKYLEMYAQRYPTDKRSKDALFNSGLYRATLHDFDGSKIDRSRFLESYPTDPDAAKVAYAMCESLEKQAELMEQDAKDKGGAAASDKAIEKKWEDAHDCYYKYVQNHEYAKSDLDAFCQAQFRRAEIMRQKVKNDKVYNELTEFIFKSWPALRDKAGVEALPHCAAAVAELKFRALALPFHNYTLIEISELDPTPKGTKKFNASIKTKTTARDKLIEDFKGVMEIGVAEWALAAAYRIGEAHQDSIDKLLKAPIPDQIGKDKLNQETKDMLRDKLREMSTPELEQAIDAFQLCVNKANELGVYNKWSVRALDQLNRLKPEAFPLIVEQLAPVSFTDAFTVVRNSVVVPDGDEWRSIPLGSMGAKPAAPPAGAKPVPGAPAPGAAPAKGGTAPAPAASAPPAASQAPATKPAASGGAK